MDKSQLVQERIGDHTYWFSPATPRTVELSQPSAYLLPNYDEYTVGYADRSAIFDEMHAPKLDPRSKLLTNVMLLNGQIVGTWTRTLKNDFITITLNSFILLNQGEASAFVTAANRYSAFLGRPVKVIFAK
jgi:hypothetical protein